MTKYPTLSDSDCLNPSERALLAFSLRLYLLHRSLHRVSLRSLEVETGGITAVSEAIRDLYEEFTEMTEATLERLFAAMFGIEIRRWENHLATIICPNTPIDALSSDLMSEMEGVLRNGEDFLPYLRNGSAKALALMLTHFRAALSRVKASRLEVPNDLEFSLKEWDRALTAVWNEQCREPGERGGSWRCLSAALNEVSEVLTFSRRITQTSDAHGVMVASTQN